MQGNSCACAASCDDESDCMGWTYIPSILGHVDMGNNDCILYATWSQEFRRRLNDECNEECVGAAQLPGRLRIILNSTVRKVCCNLYFFVTIVRSDIIQNEYSIPFLITNKCFVSHLM